MFSITREKVAPILGLVRQSDPVVDFSKMGDWGIIFICCGALAGQTRSGRAKLLEHLNAPITPESIVHKGDDEYYAGCLAEFIEEWSQDVGGISLAKQRLKETGRYLDDNYGPMLPYFSIAIMLNSLTDLDTDQFRKLKEWVNKSELGWPGFFFAAGFLLSSRPLVKWDQWASALLAINAQTKHQLKELFDSYSKEA